MVGVTGIEELEMRGRESIIEESNNNNQEQQTPPSPSYTESQFDTIIIRRQRTRPSNALKLPLSALSRTSTTSIDSTNYPPPSKIKNWQFAGWGKIERLEIGEDEVRQAKIAREEERKVEGEGRLGTWLATGIAGVAVAGSPFYSFPAVVSVSSVYSPLSLFIATSLLYFWRPIMIELANVVPISGANYVYLLNASSLKSLAIFAAALTLLDDVSTATVSAATASSYISDQIQLPFNSAWLCVLLLIGVGVLGALDVRENAKFTSAMLGFHLLTMATLFISSLVWWGKNGNSNLSSNWIQGQPLDGAAGIVKCILKGTCLGFLAVTGFECTPDYISLLRPKTYPKVLLNLQLIALILNGPLMLLVFVVLPLDSITNNNSVLNSLGEIVGGKWLRILITLDAVLILCGGILTGIISASSLIIKLTMDGILPRFFLKKLWFTGSHFIALGVFILLSILLYASCGADLAVVSSMFAITFLSIMLLYPLSLLILNYVRPNLLPSKPYSLSILYPLFTFLLTLGLIIGNIILSPSSLWYFLGFSLILTFIFKAMNKKSKVLELIWWVVDRMDSSESSGLECRSSGGNLERFKEKIVRGMKEVKSNGVIIFIKGDEINRLFEMILYVQKNEDTGNIKLVHFYKDFDDVPSELESNYKILDEAFPGITIDLIYVQGSFSPSIISVISNQFKIPRALCFIGCPNKVSSFTLGEFDGVRVII